MDSSKGLGQAGDIRQSPDRQSRQGFFLKGLDKASESAGIPDYTKVGAYRPGRKILNFWPLYLQPSPSQS